MKRLCSVFHDVALSSLACLQNSFALTFCVWLNGSVSQTWTKCAEHSWVLGSRCTMVVFCMCVCVLTLLLFGLSFQTNSTSAHYMALDSFLSQHGRIGNNSPNTSLNILMSLCCKAFPFTLENLDLVQRAKQAVLEEFSLDSVHKGTSKSCTVSALLGDRQGYMDCICLYKREQEWKGSSCATHTN